MKRILLSSLLIAVAASVSLFAQESRAMVPPPPNGPVMPCPYPYNQTFTSGPQATPIAAQFPAGLQAAIAGSVWNHTAINRQFGHTFSFPSQRECCLITSGKLEVTIKALQGGGANSSTSANDAVHVIVNGASATYQQPWLTTGVATGDTQPVYFTLTAAQLASGNISIYVQDDSAVVSARLTVSGCCTRKP